MYIYMLFIRHIFRYADRYTYYAMREAYILCRIFKIALPHGAGYPPLLKT